MPLSAKTSKALLLQSKRIYGSQNQQMLRLELSNYFKKRNLFCGPRWGSDRDDLLYPFTCATELMAPASRNAARCSAENPNTPPALLPHAD
jgi:hypothetical protein